MRVTVKDLESGGKLEGVHTQLSDEVRVVGLGWGPGDACRVISFLRWTVHILCNL